MVAVLFARADSVYRHIDGCDVWDMARDARKFRGGAAVVAHPPCRAWGRLRGMAKPREDEKDLALFAVEKVRACGGVLEHPAASTLWGAAALPKPGAGRDKFGGFSVAVNQSDFGHRARKATWLYCCGIEPDAVPAVPAQMGLEFTVVELLPKWEREATPRMFAEWLVDLASRCGR